MVSSSQIREQLALLLNKQIDLDKFEDWLIQNTWNIHLSGSSAAEELTFAIEESLSEHSSGHVNENKLLEELARILHADTVSVEVVDALQPVWLEQPVFSFRSLAPSVLAPILARP